MLADASSSNTQHWVNGLTKYGMCQVKIWSLQGTGKKGGVISFLLRIFSFLRAIFFLSKEIKAFTPDVIIGYRTTSYGFLAAIMGRKPLVLAAQGVTDVWPPDGRLAPLKSWFAKYAIKKADLIHAWGRNMTDSLFELGAHENQVLIMPRGIDTKKFYPKYDIKANGEWHIIVTRGLYPEYGHLVIIKAVIKLLNKGHNIRLHLFGDGILREKIEDIISSNNLNGKIILHGKIPNDNLPDHLRKSHIYISMTETEGVSTSLLEAMACGCYPIVSDLPANRLYISQNTNGILSKVNDAKELGINIEKVIQGGISQKILDDNYKMIQNEVSLEKNMKSFVSAYNQLVNNKNRH